MWEDVPRLSVLVRLVESGIVTLAKLELRGKACNQITFCRNAPLISTRSALLCAPCSCSCHHPPSRALPPGVSLRMCATCFPPSVEQLQSDFLRPSWNPSL